MRVIGLDPGLRHTGWGVIDVDGTRLSHVANGVVSPDATLPIAERLAFLHKALLDLIEDWSPTTAAVEETFVNKNPESTLKLGLARGAVLLAPALLGLEVAEYAPKTVKKSVVGVGAADKDQVQAMVRRLLPKATFKSADAADALAVAICHAHAVGARQRTLVAAGAHR